MISMYFGILEIPSGFSGEPRKWDQTTNVKH